jgi:nucleotide-binding universal stress UspA family protein
MSYKTILVHLHDKRRSHRMLEAVMPLARQMDAHLSALSVLPPFIIIPALEGAGGAITIEDHRDAYQLETNIVKEQFLSSTKGQALRSDWSEVDAGFSPAAGAIIERGHSVDLIVASQKDHDWGYSETLEAPERIAIESGRPLLLIPNAGKSNLLIKRATIAWNGRREAARAVFDALPLLKRASEVNVIWVDPDGDRDNAGDLPAAEICNTLSRHGIKCQASQASAVDSGVGTELLRQTAAFGSDLLVMGCYGHSRLREYILGGASREVLDQMKLPVLMSH